MKRIGAYMLPGLCVLAMMVFSGCGQGDGGTGSPVASGAKEVVVSTSSPQFDSDADETTQTVSGLDSPAFLFNGNSGQWASWRPGVSGTYEIFASVPTGTQIAGNVYYKILPDGVNTIFAKPSGVMEQGWAKLESSDQKTVFNLTENGYAFVLLGEDEEGFPAGTSPANNDGNLTLPVDAVKFVRVDNAAENAIAQIVYTDTETQEESMDAATAAPEGVVAKSVATASARASISSIGGYSSGSSVSGAKWQGQPSRAPSWASNKYMNYYAIDSKSDSSWTIKGSNFGTRTGVITFSDSRISCKITSWKNNEIKLVPKVPYYFTYDSSVTLTIYVDNGSACVFGCSKTIPVVGLIKSRGYGQCTWYAAYKRLDNGKSIPDSAYATKSINSSYEPTKWDYLSYGSQQHVAIISSSVSKSERTDSSGNKYTTYSFRVGEMNPKWDELIWDTGYAHSSYSATFEVKTDKKGNKSITKSIGSNAGMTATGYYR